MTVVDADDPSLMASLVETQRMLLDTINLIPIQNWGFDVTVEERLRQRKHRMVNQRLTKEQKRKFSHGAKQRMAKDLGGVPETVGEVLKWMASTEEKTKPTKKEAGIAKAKESKQVAKEKKKEQQKKTKELKKPPQVANVPPKPQNGTNGKKTEESSSDEEMEVEKVEKKKSKKEKKGEINMDKKVEERTNEADSDVEEGEEEKKVQENGLLPPSIANKNQKRKAERALAVGQNTSEGEPKRPKLAPLLPPVDFSKMDPIEARKVAMERLQMKIQLMKKNRQGKRNLEHFEQERKTKRRMSKLKLKQQRAEEKKQNNKDSKAVKKEPTKEKGLKEERNDTVDGKIVYSKFDYIVRDDPEKKKVPKSAKRDKFTGKDYERLLQKAEKRKERLDGIREKNPEKAERIETDIKWDKALNMAAGVKVKDNIELLKKAAKRKEKLKVVKKAKWNKRVTNIEQEKAKKQEKRDTNIQKRKDIVKKHKMERLRKKGRIL